MTLEKLRLKVEVLKIRTKKGRIITLTVSSKSLTHYVGTDLFNQDVIIPIDEIDCLLPEGEE